MADIRFNFDEPIVIPKKTALWIHPSVQIDAKNMRVIGTYYDIYEDGTMDKAATDFIVVLEPNDLLQIMSIVQTRATEQGVLRASTPQATFPEPDPQPSGDPPPEVPPGP